MQYVSPRWTAHELVSLNCFHNTLHRRKINLFSFIYGNNLSLTFTKATLPRMDRRDALIYQQSFKSQCNDKYFIELALVVRIGLYWSILVSRLIYSPNIMSVTVLCYHSLGTQVFLSVGIQSPRST